MNEDGRRRRPWWDLWGLLQRLDDDVPDHGGPLDKMAKLKADRYLEKDKNGNYKHSAEG